MGHSRSSALARRSKVACVSASIAARSKSVAPASRLRRREAASLSISACRSMRLKLTPRSSRKFPALREHDPSLLAIVVSHGHRDHWGLIPKVRPDIPIVMGRATENIMLAAADPEKSAEVDDGSPHFSSVIDQHIHYAAHILVGGADHFLSEDALDLLVGESLHLRSGFRLSGRSRSVWRRSRRSWSRFSRSETGWSGCSWSGRCWSGCLARSAVTGYPRAMATRNAQGRFTVAAGPVWQEVVYRQMPGKAGVNRAPAGSSLPTFAAC
jgi:hypothetical protein